MEFCRRVACFIIILLLVDAVPRSYGHKSSWDEKCTSSEGVICTVKNVAVATAAGTAAAAVGTAGGTAALGAAGFTSSGIAAGSLAAGVQSFLGSVGAGSIFATLQSAAATGGLAMLSPFGIAAGIAGATLGGYYLTEPCNSKLNDWLGPSEDDE